ncbi:chemotaxis protein CheW [Curvibacter sp. APW13]|uniref:chemotaxis protein CheW n=1 Tax=Curvibacter sp. APW13 TaxID=3077236 RepID=UPI0028DEDC48|nr:chemotaxis protein CheW [Curvibacter sp. APW13]MDT8989703.1 chemotaxis protein CheW [Curvibacter sp. APW13]
MANRDAIRELQTRLASRLQAARTEGVAVSWLAVKAGGSNFLFPLGQSGEIFPVSGLQAVPYAKPWFHGVINIRGGLFGVVELAGFLHEVAQRPRQAVAGAEPSVVTLNPALEVNCALQVDALAGLRGPEDFVAYEPAAADAPDFYGNQFADASGQRWQEINLRTLSLSPQFLSISV